MSSWKWNWLSCVQLFASPWNIPSMNSPGQNTGVGSLSLLEGILPTQRSNPGLLHCRQILYQLNHKGSPRILEWLAYPFSRGSFWPWNQTGVSCITGRFYTNWAILVGLQKCPRNPDYFFSICTGENIVLCLAGELPQCGPLRTGRKVIRKMVKICTQISLERWTWLPKSRDWIFYNWEERMAHCSEGMREPQEQFRTVKCCDVRFC